MRIVISSVFFMLIASISFAQMSESTQQEYNRIVELCNLNENQKLDLQEVYAKRVSDLESIEYMRGQNEKKFRIKRRSIYTGAHQSIQLLLDPEQIEAFRQFEIELRTKRGEITRELIKAGASREDILDAQVGIEIE